MVDTPEPKAGATTTELRVIATSADHALGVVHNVVLVAWRRDTLSQAIGQVSSTLRELGARRARELGLLQLVCETATVPSRETRSELSDMLRGANGILRCSCVVFPGNSFRIAAGRAIASGIAMFARQDFPHVVFQHLEDAADWQVQQLGRGPRIATATQILTSMAALVRASEDADR
jgi:hypothetical protein